jgi:hypothetical protein
MNGRRSTPHSRLASAGPFTTPALSSVYIFSSVHVNTYTFSNAMVCIAFFINATISAVALRVVVARAKKCWDFGATIYIFHLLAVTIWEGFPLHWFWWVVIISCGSMTVLLGELLCVRFEMADIPITGA